MMPTLDAVVVDLLKNRITDLESTINADVITVFGPIQYGVEQRFQKALDLFPTRRDCLGVVLDTPGGIVEVVERMVQAARHHYSNVIFIVPDKAMSAGTVLAMSGDRILMNCYSVLGPIDPQLPKEGKFIPALAYLSEYEALVEKSRAGTLTTAEYALLAKFDLGELHTFKQARDLSIDLLVNWLSTYKFKDWARTQSRGAQVTPAMRQERAREVARALSDHARWHSHGRCINMKTLTDELNIKIEDYGLVPAVKEKVHNYFDVFVDYLTQKGIASFVHSSCFI